MDTIFIFDYDETIMTDMPINGKIIEELKSLVSIYKEKFNVPLIILTAGSVNDDVDTLKMMTSRRSHVRPYELFNDMCGLNVEINRFNRDVDVCLFGKYIAKNKSKLLPLVNNLEYIHIGHDLYSPSFNIYGTWHRLLSCNESKNMSVIYHLIRENKDLKPFIILVDDVEYHNFSGLDNLILDPFETMGAMYYKVKPLSGNKEVLERLIDLRNSIKNNIIHLYLSRISENIWKRYENM